MSSPEFDTRAYVLESKITKALKILHCDVGTTTLIHEAIKLSSQSNQNLRRDQIGKLIVSYGIALMDDNAAEVQNLIDLVAERVNLQWQPKESLESDVELARIAELTDRNLLRHRFKKY